LFVLDDWQDIAQHCNIKYIPSVSTLASAAYITG